MARTYSKTPEPRYVELAKRSIEGSGAFICIYGETTWADAKAALDKGQSLVCKLRAEIEHYGIVDLDIPTFALIDRGDPDGQHINFIYQGANSDPNEDYMTCIIIASLGDNDAWDVHIMPTDAITYLEYEQATFSEIYEALTLNKLVVMIVDGVGYTFCKILGEAIEFRALDGSGVFLVYAESDETRYSEIAHTLDGFFWIENNTPYETIDMLMSFSGETFYPALYYNDRIYYFTGYTSNGDIRLDSNDGYYCEIVYDSQNEITTYNYKRDPRIIVLNEGMTYDEVYAAIITSHVSDYDDCIFILKDSGGRIYNLVDIDVGGSPAYFRFKGFTSSTYENYRIYTIDDATGWTTQYINNGLYFVEPGSTSFMDIVEQLQNNIQPVINDTVNGRAYYISDYTMVGGQPAAITFSTIGANTPHTWTVDYQNNWSST